ncbi:unnamed protein product [Durusdinium trenchii]|uniref:FHA domain-containing protein n=1 Tax=Durusdinium trenchii TaxID=1381693 RepID=A0ABP0QHL9_9DINO
MPCCFSPNRQLGVSDELEKVLAHRDILRQKCDELRSRVEAAPARIQCLQEDLRKSRKHLTEIAKCLQLCKATDSQTRNATASSAAALVVDPLFDEARLLEGMGLEPDVPWLLIEAWCTNALLGEQWLRSEDLERKARKSSSGICSIPLEPRLLFSRKADEKMSIESVCGGALPGGLGALHLHFNKTEEGAETVLSDLQLSCTRACKHSAIPGKVNLQIWCWGGAVNVETSKRRQRSIPLDATCWLEAMASEDSPKNRAAAGRLQVRSDEALVIGRHHAVIQGLLDKKDLSCVSREHLRLWFNKKTKTIQVENTSGNPIVINNGNGRRLGPIASSSNLQTVRAGKLGRAQSGDVLQLLRPESTNESAKDERNLSGAGPLLSFRIVVHQPKMAEIVCAGKNCNGGGGDPLYEVQRLVSAELSHSEIYCASCCDDPNMKSSMYSFKKLPYTLPAAWNLLCESDAVPAESYPGLQGLFTWGADFGMQKLHLPNVTPSSQAIAQKVESRNAQTEHSRCAASEEEQKEERPEADAEEHQDRAPEEEESEELAVASRENGEVPLAAAELSPQELPLDEASGDWESHERANSLNFEDGKGRSVFIPVAEPQAGSGNEIELSASAGVHQELEDFDHLKHLELTNHKSEGFEGDAKKDLIQDASDDQARSPSGKKRVLHDVEPLHPHTDDENHQLFLKLLCHRTGVLYKGEHLEIHANVQQASRSIDLTATVTLVYVATRNRKLSRLEATLETDFAALHCECGQNSFTEGLLTVLLDEQATSFEQKIKFELMDVLGQPPSMNVKANLVGEMNEEPMELANFFIRLPLLVTSFLKPLQPTFRFKQARN